MGLKKENILIVDDNFDMLELLHRHLKALNFHTYKASSIAEAHNLLQYTSVDLLITDLQMPGGSGLELLVYAKEHFPGMPSLVITGFPSIDTALKATKLGALEYLAKPFTAEEFRKAVHNSLQQNTELPKGPKKTPRPSVKYESYAGMVGSSKKFRDMVDIITRVKDNRATVLITGESGTGKELVARAIHYKGAFAANPFIAVNCAALPENLIESELFGYTKGAFSGANETKKGLFEAADGGTIFLDEIGTIPYNVQSRLLRVLQEKEVRKIGAQQSQKINVRIVSATNSDLLHLVHEKQFREDLYYRLNVVTIETAPLRERKDDILLLVHTFLKKYGEEYGRPSIAISDAAMQVLQSYSWPGNIRELENTVQRMIIMADTAIEVAHIPESITQPGPEHPFKKESMLLSLQEAEKAHILKVLAAVGDNKTKAAEILGIDRKTLRSKLL